MLTEPKHEGGGRRFLVVALAVVAVLVAAALAFWLFARRPAGPKGPPPAPRARTSPSPRATATPVPAPEARATPRPRTEPRAEAATTTLRVDADVPGANVFLDRKFLGTTPSRPGTSSPARTGSTCPPRGTRCTESPSSSPPGRTRWW